VPIQIGNWQLRSSSAHYARKLAKSEERRIDKAEMDVEMEEEGGQEKEKDEEEEVKEDSE